jgi:hypothetical protein
MHKGGLRELEAVRKNIKGGYLYLFFDNEEDKEME